jgi:LAS superfamily LD-carboxypeptidase LdcB
MITHTVAFRLRHARGSDHETAFLHEALALAGIPGVEDFQQMRQVGKKVAYDFGFSMRFADQSAYDAYNDHPVHVAFVRDRWAAEVADFIELDYLSIRGAEPA